MEYIHYMDDTLLAMAQEAQENTLIVTKGFKC